MTLAEIKKVNTKKGINRYGITPDRKGMVAYPEKLKDSDTENSD